MHLVRNAYAYGKSRERERGVNLYVFYVVIVIRDWSLASDRAGIG